MKRKLSFMLVWGLIGGLATLQTYAQRGVGDPAGVAQQVVKPRVEAFSGTVQAIVIKPCEMTTGRSVTGTHILLETAEGVRRNIHLGPAASVKHITDKLVVGQKVEIQAFRTEKLPNDNYAAQSLTIGDEKIVLRDANLRPMWAGVRAAAMDRNRSQAGVVGRRGLGPDDQGSDAAYVQGRGRCGNVANGPGRGSGRGAGFGQRSGGRGQGQGRRGGIGRGQGQGFGRGQCFRCEQQLGAMIESLPKESVLSEKERAGLLLMREEEKLAHDVYVTLGKKWGLRPLANINQAELRHMDIVKMLLDRYGLDDPIDKMAVGEFSSQPMQLLYDQFVARGNQSIEEAIKVGAEIEELDVFDLRRLIDETDNDDIKIVYQNLLKGSRNHLRAFARQLGRYNAAYLAKYLSQVEFDRIANSSHERGAMITEPGYEF